MIQLNVARLKATDFSTPGRISINGVFECYTLEPKNPIPAGTFKVELIQSPKFTALYKKLFITPHIQDVPGHTYIEIHRGNWPRDTKDCTLVGATESKDCVGESEIAFDALMAKLTVGAKLVRPQDPSQAAYYELPEPILITYEDYAPTVVAGLVTDPELGL